jgi:hypothetical protein
MFAWGLARLGDTGGARSLMTAASDELRSTRNAAKKYADIDPIHAWLFDAFTFRIDEATSNRSHGGPWPGELLRQLDEVDAKRPHSLNSQRYVIDRLQNTSRILEPTELVDPYAKWKRESRLAGTIRALFRTHPTDQLEVRVREYSDRVDRELDVLERLQAYWSLVINDEINRPHIGAELAIRAGKQSADALRPKWADDPDVLAVFARHRPTPSNRGNVSKQAAYRADAREPGPWVERTIYGHAAGFFSLTLRAAVRNRWPAVAGALAQEVVLLLGSAAPGAEQLGTPAAKCPKPWYGLE